MEAFQSILFEPSGAATAEPAAQPPFFADLNLDQLVASVVADRENYHLEPLFWLALHDVAAVRYRHEVLRDLEREAIIGAVRAFAEGMREMHGRLALVEKLYFPRQKQRLFMEAVNVYCKTVRAFAHDLGGADVNARAVRALHAYLEAYTHSERFVELEAETRALDWELAAIRYRVQILGSRVSVSEYHEEPDYSAEVEETFAKFREGAVKDYRASFHDDVEMNPVESLIYDRVARLHPQLFAEVDDYCERHTDFLEETLDRFDREVQFYLAYLEYAERLKAAGLRFSRPRVSSESKETYVEASFDLVLADKLVREGREVVCNDFYLQDPERVVVITGPNQGGKTTFARMFGQLHYLASLGLPVPGRTTQLFLPDQIFTHFEREEDITTLRGKLEDELLRIHRILEHATSDSVIIMNESFTSTTVEDALFLGARVMSDIVSLGLLAVYVTFLDELSSFSEATVSMVSTVDPDNPALRTYEILRRPADGLAYAAALAEKYGLTHDALRARIAR
ncbi:MAG TPA: hypothetical protein VMB05_04895 [Solirubrobacteraceae bacterium]|nr:hypothetical protein [Solirubrobacteraceae bacterium]